VFGVIKCRRDLFKNARRLFKITGSCGKPHSCHAGLNPSAIKRILAGKEEFVDTGEQFLITCLPTSNGAQPVFR
jgi:hypothetical protein